MLFWNGKKLASELNIVGQLYPKLFSFSLSDLHTYEASGKLMKSNCYSTYFDMISGKGNKPVRFHNYAKKLASSVMDVKMLKEIIPRFNSLRREMELSFSDLIGQVQAAQCGTGGIRAEFRVRMSDMVSLMPMLNEFFSKRRIQNCSMIFRSSDITRLARFYIDLLKKPMLLNITMIMKQFELRTVNNHEIFERIGTISLLESLLTATLFSGLQYSFASELVWNKSQAERSSFELLQSIKLNNRLVFKSGCFNENDFKIKCVESLLNTMFGKILKSQAFQFPPVDNLISFSTSNSCSEKAEILWKIYFSELNPNAFLGTAISTSADRNETLQRWKLAALNREVITSFNEDKISFRGAVGAVFNFEKFTQFGSWKNKYYLILANEMINLKKELTQIDLVHHLVRAMKSLEIEHFHYPGALNFNGNSSRHLYVDCSDDEDGLITAETSELRITNLDLMNQVRNKRYKVARWIPQDLKTLVEGVNKYSTEKKKFHLISTDSRLKFLYPREVSRIRDKWNKLVDSDKAYFDEFQWRIRGLFTNTNDMQSSTLRLNSEEPASSTIVSIRSTPVLTQTVPLEVGPAPPFNSAFAPSSPSSSSSNESAYYSDNAINEDYGMNNVNPNNFRHEHSVFQNFSELPSSSNSADSIFEGLIGNLLHFIYHLFNSISF